MNNNIETFKLQHVALEFKVNEVKQTITAIEKMDNYIAHQKEYIKTF